MSIEASFEKLLNKCLELFFYFTTAAAISTWPTMLFLDHLEYFLELVLAILALFKNLSNISPYLSMQQILDWFTFLLSKG